MIDITNAKDFSRKHIQAPDVRGVVAQIIATVREKGDCALFAYEQKFDGVTLSQLEVSEKETDEAMDTVGHDYIKLLLRAAGNIHDFHKRQARPSFSFSPKDGVILGQRVIPLQRVGLYVPGGTAAYPSTVLMNAIPAKIAGCREIIITSPNPKPEILARRSGRRRFGLWYGKCTTRR